MTTQKPYSELGKLLDTLARERDVRGAQALAAFVRARPVAGPGRSGWGQILYGDITPTTKTMALFASAFELTEKERERVAMLYTFRGVMAA